MRAAPVAAAAVIGVLLALAAGPFWANGMILAADPPWRGRLASWSAAASGVYATVGCMENVGFVWTQCPILYQHTVLSRDVPIGGGVVALITAETDIRERAARPAYYERLRPYRKRAGLSARAVSKRCGVNWKRFLPTRGRGATPAAQPASSFSSLVFRIHRLMARPMTRLDAAKDSALVAPKPCT